MPWTDWMIAAIIGILVAVIVSVLWGHHA